MNQYCLGEQKEKDGKFTDRYSITSINEVPQFDLRTLYKTEMQQIIGDCLTRLVLYVRK